MKTVPVLLRIMLVFGMLAGMFFSTPTRPARAATTFTVNTVADEASDSECVIDCTLREAIELADNGDTINITTTGTIVMDTGLPVPGYQISKSITIIGPGSSNLTIDAGFNHRIFYIYDTATDGVIISGLTLTSGDSSGEGGVQYGGAIASLAPLTLNDMVIDHNTAGTANGGGIYMNGAFLSTIPTLTISNSILTNNSSAVGGNLFIAEADLDMSDTTVSGGSADYGGGIYIEVFGDTSPDLSIASSRITSNIAAFNGGGISMSDKTRLIISHSSIDQNEAAANGGGIHYNSTELTSTLNIFNSTIGANLLTATGTPGSADTNTGAGLYIRGNANIINSTIIDNDGERSNNTGTNSFGGGIYSLTLLSATQTLYNSIIANNIADNGSAIEGNLTSGGYNLVEEGATGFTNLINNDIVGSDPLLDPLEVNAIGTAHYPLTSLSPALDKIPSSNVYCGAVVTYVTDQRGVLRPQNTSCDIGAFERDITAPTVSSITMVNPSPTTASTVVFNVAFSEWITGLDVGDFSLSTKGTISGATITDVSLTGDVTVSNISGNGTIKLIIPNSATIIDYAGLGLAGLPFNSGAEYIKTSSFTNKSNSTNDGWVLESAEASNAGGTLNNTQTTFILGDDAADRQYRAFLHFDTSALPDNAIITSTVLKIKEQSSSGSNPFSILGSLYVDLRTPSFGANALELLDFNFTAKKVKTAIFNPTPVSGWYSARFNNGGNTNINRKGSTQLRLYFLLDDNDNNNADFIRFVSGNGSSADRPKLIIQYYVP